jgi:6,7-dimethyl-8-ribityllumazine synthase
MPRVFEGLLTAQDVSFAIVLARFNSFIGERLLEGALDTLRRHGADMNAVDIFKVPGCFEIPMIAQRVARARRHDAIICLGTLIRGSTPHFDYIASEVTKGIAAISLETGMPLTYGVLTCDSLEQAIDRAGAKAGNKGSEAAVAAIEMVNLYRTLS